MRILQTLFIALWLLTSGLLQAHPLEEGVAITDPALMERLDQIIGIGQMLAKQPEHAAPITNADLFKRPDLRQINTYISLRSKQFRDKVKDADDQFLDDLFLNKGFATFQLAGIINRMDRAFVPSHREACGEVRLIYRLFYNAMVAEGAAGNTIQSRLPFTLNLVLNARTAADIGATTVACAAVAKRWLATPPPDSSLDQRVAFLQSEGALKGLGPAQIDRIEINFQIMRLPANFGREDVRSFGGRAEYIMSVFRRDQRTGVFERNRMENQVDLASLTDGEKQKLRQAVLNTAFFRDLDNGRAIIPSDLSATEAISVAPGGLTRTQNRPFDSLFTKADYDEVVKKLAQQKEKLFYIKSFDGFVAKLNDLTCNGCHQQRAIAGFHFPGADWPGSPQLNTVFVPGSAHFYGDLPRRLDIVQAFAVGKAPNFRRAFAGRPENRVSAALASTQIADGWGAPCYTGSDTSFVAFKTCRAGLQCDIVSASERAAGFGMCQPALTAELGDALEITQVHYGAPNAETLSKPLSEKYPSLQPPTYTRSFQGGKDGSGGFPGGMLRLKACTQSGDTADMNRPESICVPIAGDGFNNCLATHGFLHCMTNFTQLGGARACNVDQPCREDYICTSAGNDKRGVCIPPYFVFQFRVDKHHPDDLLPPAR